MWITGNDIKVNWSYRNFPVLIVDCRKQSFKYVGPIQNSHCITYHRIQSYIKLALHKPSTINMDS